MPEPLSRLFAYVVVPKQPPTGGPVPIGASVEQALDEAYRRAGLAQGRTVGLMVDEETGSSEVRDALIGVAFAGEESAGAGADLLAERLSTAMDQRSPAGLLVLSVHGGGATREVELWIFPRNEAFRYNAAGGGDRIELADDIFSISSSVRKAASFRGRDQGQEFLTGRVVDFQAHGADRYVAGFWVDGFLQARLEMAGDEGTLLFGKTVKQAFDSLRGDAAAQQELAAAVGRIRSHRQRLSVGSFADDQLTGVAAEALVASAPHSEAADVSFDFDPARFEQVVRFRVFRLDSGVVVTAPMEALDSGEVTEEGGILELRGSIVDQTVRSRRG